jgi:predicted dehydrogenase
VILQGKVRRMAKRKVKFGVAGLGHIAKKSILPGFVGSVHAELVTVFSSDPAKRADIASKYELAQTFSYDEFEIGLKQQQIEAIYLALPNNLHKEYAVRAVRCGVHVLCEKPLASSAADCEAIIDAARKSKVKLMVAYRHHFGAAHQDAMETAHGGKLGELRSFHSVFTLQVRENNPRTQRAMGGGTLPDIGVYVINVARQLFRAEPQRVYGFATTRPDDPRFSEVEEMFTGVMQFPKDRLATFTCGFGSARVMTYTIVGTRGSLYVDPAYDYGSDISSELIVDGIRERRVFQKQDQFAAQIDYFARCVLYDEPPAESGEEGLADLRVVEALYQSAGENAHATAGV